MCWIIIWRLGDSVRQTSARSLVAVNDINYCVTRFRPSETTTGEWISKKIVLCALFVRFQGIIEGKLEIG